jgi:hypothetical protein
MQPLLPHSFDDGERTTKHGIFGGLAAAMLTLRFMFLFVADNL